MNRIIFLFILMTAFENSFAQNTTLVLEQYNRYRETSLSDRRFKHDDIEKLIKKREGGGVFKVKEEGKSAENRAIYSLEIGNGPIKLLLWSQMHGDEATATMALMDLFNFFDSHDEFDAFKKDLLSKVTLYFIPMLNPDGAARFQRRTAMDIDMNRDAVRLQSPESNILKNKRDQTNADFGFNLHDQRRLYSVGNTPHPATISFLSPAYNYAKETNEVRANSMKLIALLTRELQEYIPGNVAKYSDEFEPRAFGDNIQKWGTSLILIESGGYPGDRDKQYIRKMNFYSILRSFEVIASGEYKKENIANYDKIEFNDQQFVDVMIKNATVEQFGSSFKLDIAINQSEISYDEFRKYRLQGQIEDVGDLSVFYGYETFDASGLTAVPGKVKPGNYSLEELKKLNAIELIKEGYLYVMTDQKLTDDQRFKLNVVGSGKSIPAMNFKLGNQADFILLNGNKPVAAVMNGFIIDLTKPLSAEVYGHIY